MLAASASANPPSATATDVCHAVARAGLRNRKCTYPMWAANTIALPINADNRQKNRIELDAAPLARVADAMPMAR